jgi:SET domain-containing protein
MTILKFNKKYRNTAFFLSKDNNNIIQFWYNGNVHLIYINNKISIYVNRDITSIEEIDLKMLEDFIKVCKNIKE